MSRSFALTLAIAVAACGGSESTPPVLSVDATALAGTYVMTAVDDMHASPFVITDLSCADGHHQKKILGDTIVLDASGGAHRATWTARFIDGAQQGFVSYAPSLNHWTPLQQSDAFTAGHAAIDMSTSVDIAHKNDAIHTHIRLNGDGTLSARDSAGGSCLSDRWTTQVTSTFRKL